MVKEVTKVSVKLFLDQAEFFLNTAKEKFAEGVFNVSAFNAVQSMINSNDALTIFFLGKRGSSNHNEALDLHNEVAKKINDGSQKDRLKEALFMRNNAGYQGVLISKANSERALRSAILFFEWVKRVMK